MKNHVKQLDHLNMTVASFEESAAWYGRVFGFEVAERGTQNGRPWGVLRAGEAMLCIYETPERAAPRKDGGRHTIHHFGLRITDTDAWLATLERERLQLGYGSPIEYPFSTSWYVTDPSGHVLEVAAWDEDRVAFREAS